MAGNGAKVTETKQWIRDEQKIHEMAPFGRNARAVSDALHEQQRRVKVVENAESRVQEADDEEVRAQYATLKRTANHRAACLRDVNDIASLEASFNVSDLTPRNVARQFILRSFANILISHHCGHTLQ